MKEKRYFDPARITTLLHYEQIPNFVMTKEQKQYLEDWRREALNRPSFAKQKAQEAVVVTVNTKAKKKTTTKKAEEPVVDEMPEELDAETADEPVEAEE